MTLVRLATYPDPAVSGSQELEKVSRQYPAWQLLQLVADVHELHPVGHARQAVAPALALNVPEGHTGHPKGPGKPAADPMRLDAVPGEHNGQEVKVVGARDA